MVFWCTHVAQYKCEQDPELVPAQDSQNSPEHSPDQLGSTQLEHGPEHNPKHHPGHGTQYSRGVVTTLVLLIIACTKFSDDAHNR